MKVNIAINSHSEKGKRQRNLFIFKMAQILPDLLQHESKNPKKKRTRVTVEKIRPYVSIYKNDLTLTLTISIRFAKIHFAFPASV